MSDFSYKHSLLLFCSDCEAFLMHRVLMPHAEFPVFPFLQGSPGSFFPHDPHATNSSEDSHMSTPNYHGALPFLPPPSCLTNDSSLLLASWFCSTAPRSRRGGLCSLEVTTCNHLVAIPTSQTITSTFLFNTQVRSNSWWILLPKCSCSQGLCLLHSGT